MWWLNVDLWLVSAMYDLPWDLIGFWKLVLSYSQSTVGFLSASSFHLVLIFCDWFGVWMRAIGMFCNCPVLFSETEVCAWKSWKSLLVCLIIYINLCDKCLIWQIRGSCCSWILWTSNTLLLDISVWDFFHFSWCLFLFYWFLLNIWYTGNESNLILYVIISVHFIDYMTW